MRASGHGAGVVTGETRKSARALSVINHAFDVTAIDGAVGLTAFSHKGNTVPVNDTLGQELPERNDLDTSAGKAIGPAQGGFRIPGEMIVDVALNPEIAARHLVSLLPGPANNHALLAGNSADLSVKLLQDWQGPPLSIRPETGLKFLIEIFGPGSAVHDILTMVAP